MLAAFSAPLRAEEAAFRFMSSAGSYQEHAIARFGPFRVVDEQRAALDGVTDEDTPAQFAAMLRAYPAIATLALVDCPGTYEDRANLQLGRMIRAAGLAIHVPRGGSVRSGGVELVMAGASLRIDDGAEFAVHAWMDEDGLQADDYAADAPENAKYLAYYREMGMTPERAQAFYAMTNSVPYEQARWFGAGEMRRWLAGGPEIQPAPPQPAQPQPALAYADLGTLDLAASLP